MTAPLARSATDALDERDPLGSLVELLVPLRSRIDDYRNIDHPHELRARFDSLRFTANPLAIGAVLDGCALAANACASVLRIELHDVQLMASIALACGWTIQLATGEGKTFAAIGPAAVFAAAGHAVHVATANPYLAERDASWSGRALEALGLEVAATVPGLTRAAVRNAYAADVVFGAGPDFGFDFLRDRLVLPGDARVQRGRGAVIVDEADFALVDEARTPLVLSESAPADADVVALAAHVVDRLDLEHDADIDATLGLVELSDRGITRCEDLLGVDNLYEANSTDWPHLLRTALRARVLVERDRDYVIRDGEVDVVDELTGRVAIGRRWSDGLHQAVEAKESVQVTNDRRPLGRITIGEYFRLYPVLVGMSGTLQGAKNELRSAYGIRTVELPTHRPIIRTDHADIEFADTAAKIDAIADDTTRRHRAGQPVLIGTTSISQAHQMADALERRQISYQLLTARNDSEEAEIVAEAGVAGAVTVATQMAGRGVDIVLGGRKGGSDERNAVCDVGGLMVWGVEHQPSRRLDQQLRGRAGRQGDPGESRFAVSPADDLAEIAPDEPSVADRVRAGQHLVEERDAAARNDVRAFGAAIDRIHDLVFDLRRSASDRAGHGRELDAAIERVADGAPEAITDAVRDWGRLPWRRGARSSRIRSWVESCFDARRTDVGRDDFEEIAGLVRRLLLVVMWPDLLESLDSSQHLARISHLFPTHRSRWDFLVFKRFEEFQEQVDTQWVLQLLHARIHRGVDIEVECPEGQGVALPGRAGSSEAGTTEVAHQANWSGWSYNKFVRKHFGMVPPDPPLVLELDAIGDLPGQRIKVRFNLDDPTQTDIWLTD